MKPLISVVVPCRNEYAFIRKTIESLFNQKNIPGGIEIIVVDGESNDGTLEILKDMKKNNNRLKVISNKKRITPVAMNLGIKGSEGEYVAVMSAHAEYDENYLSVCLSLFNKDNKIVCTGGPIINIGATAFGKAAALAMSNPIGVGNAKHRFPDYEGYAEGAGFPVFKKSVFDKIGLYDERLVRNQDDELNLRLTKQGFKVYLSPKAMSTYYVRSSFVKLFKQYFDYGYWRMATIKIHKLPVSFRQIVPALFVILLLIFFCLSLILSTNNFLIGSLLPLLYLAVIVISDLKVIKQNGIRIGILFPIAVVTMHFAYAFGFLKGIKFIFTGVK